MRVLRQPAIVLTAGIALAGLLAGCTTAPAIDAPHRPPDGFDFRYGDMRVAHLGNTQFVGVDGLLTTAPVVAVQLPPWLVLGGPNTTDPRARLVLIVATDDLSRAVAEVTDCNVIEQGRCERGHPAVRWFDPPVPWLFGASLGWSSEEWDANDSVARPIGGAARAPFYTDVGIIEWSGLTPQSIDVGTDEGQRHRLEIVEETANPVAELGQVPQDGWLQLAMEDAPDGRPPEKSTDYVPFTFAQAWHQLAQEVDVPSEPGVTYASYNGATYVYHTTQVQHLRHDTVLARQWSWKIDVDPGAAAATEYSVVKRQQYVDEQPVGEPTYEVINRGTHFDKLQFRLPSHRVSLDAGHALAVQLTGGSVPFFNVLDPDPGDTQTRHVYHYVQPPPDGVGMTQALAFDAVAGTLWRLAVPEETMKSHVIDLEALLAAAAQRGMWVDS